MKSKYSKKIFQKYFKNCLVDSNDAKRYLEEDEDEQFWHTVYLKKATIHISEYEYEFISNMHYSDYRYKNSEIYATSSNDPIKLLKLNKKEYSKKYPEKLRKDKLKNILKEKES